MGKRFHCGDTAGLYRQFQGSKKKARKAAFLERKAQADFERARRQRLREPDCGIEEMAALMGVKLK